MFAVTDEKNQLVAGPGGWGPQMQALFGLAGNLNPPARPFTRNGNTLRDVTYADLLAYQAHGSGSVVGDAWHVPSVDLSLDDAKAAAKEKHAAKRYDAETRGITVGALEIATDRHTQSVLTGARILAKEDPTYTVNWKAPQGWLVVNAAEIIAMADAVAAHIQACFDNEKTLSDAIDAAADVDAVRAVDLESGW